MSACILEMPSMSLNILVLFILIRGKGSELIQPWKQLFDEEKAGFFWIDLYL